MWLNLEDLEFPVRLHTERPMTDDELLRFTSVNEGVWFEQESNGDLSIMTPPGGEAGGLHAELTIELGMWARQDGRGKVFAPDTGFRLPDGSMRAPDAAWISWVRWNALSREQQRKYPPLCPEFVVEVRSPSDRLAGQRAKMAEWMNNGAELGWLVDPERKVVEIYRPGREAELVEGASAVYGDGPVSGFVLELARIWV